MTWNCLGLTFVKKISMPNPVKALDISSTTAQVAPDLLKSVAILSDTTVRKYVVDWEDLKPHWKIEKGHISLDDQQSFY